MTALHPDIATKIARELAGLADLEPATREHVRAAMLRAVHRAVEVTRAQAGFQEQATFNHQPDALPATLEHG